MTNNKKYNSTYELRYPILCLFLYIYKMWNQPFKSLYIRKTDNKNTHLLTLCKEENCFQAMQMIKGTLK